MGAWIFPVLFVSLGLTLLLEEGFAWLFRIRNRWDMGLIALVNLLTNPAVVFLYYVNLLYAGMNVTGVTVCLEITAAAVEGLCYRAAAGEIKHPWIFSIGANLFSFFLGALISGTW